MKLKRCKQCGETTADGLIIYPAYMKAAGASAVEVRAAEELRDIARVLSITADTDANIKEAIKGIMNIADRLQDSIFELAPGAIEVLDECEKVKG